MHKQTCTALSPVGCKELKFFTLHRVLVGRSWDRFPLVSMNFSVTYKHKIILKAEKLNLTSFSNI